MINIEYQIIIYSYWHPGGKDGSTMKFDSTVLENDKKLPYMGGKTIKGLIKDGAKFVNKYHNNLVSNKFINDVFGKEDKEYSINEKGSICNKFTSAEIHEDISKDLAPFLVDSKSNTAITDQKQAKKYSLRTTQAVIPLILQGNIFDFTGDIKELEYSIKAVKKLGKYRNRGFGRCEIKILNKNYKNGYSDL